MVASSLGGWFQLWSSSGSRSQSYVLSTEQPMTPEGICFKRFQTCKSTRMQIYTKSEAHCMTPSLFFFARRGNPRM